MHGTTATSATSSITAAATTQWSYLLNAQRLGSSKKAKSGETARSPFHKDYDRLVFSHSFRQLNQKTQVHPLTNQLGIHTRLTHSLEVSCIGRSLGMMAAEKLHDSLSGGLPRGVTPADIGVIIQAACLAHDIGNPPFGHAGEYAIRDWFNHPDRATLLSQLTPTQRLDLIGFEGNAQGFRLLVRNEHHPDKGGMRLTCATLGAFMKYPWLSSHSNPHLTDTSSTALNNATTIRKYGCFASEAQILERLANRLRLPMCAHHDGFARHPLAYLLEAADDICYALIDLEDGIHLDMLSYQEVEPLLLELVGERLGAPPEVLSDAPVRHKLAALRGRAMMRLVDKVTDAFVDKADELLAGTLEGSLFDHCDPSVMNGIDSAKTLAREQIFGHPSKVRMELMANQCLHRLLDALIPLATTLPDSAMSFEQQRLLRLVQSHFNHHHRSLTSNTYDNILNILDYLTGMNDHEAYSLAQDLNGSRSGIW
ncbi:deoxyguanosinetriphosphate triphosphohydrolase [Psychrobacter pygoscelis]|uniref:deoxyguanosinetriphosphate triphosphohydrolase n=1 Tax=Psychrobacter pygoscelis TaxID=2488563 RepID=UPI0010399386|nr:deoxyguanosinetriphosphate triphosphohydrolase [Psychrobacter pygoscelis]